MTVNAQALLITASTVSADATLAKNRLTPVDASGASRTMTLPTSVTPGVRIAVEKVDSSTNTVIISGTIRGTAGSITLYDQYDVKEFVADASGSWRPVGDHRTKSALDLHYRFGLNVPATAGMTAAQFTFVAQATINAAAALGIPAVIPASASPWQVNATLTAPSGAHIVAYGATIKNASNNNILTNADLSGGNTGIEVEGGTWDYDSTHQTPGSSIAQHALYFQHCPGIVVKNLAIDNVAKFALLLAACDDFYVDEITFNTTSDGLHVYGPCARGHVGTLRGTTGDDFCAFTIGDFPGYQTTFGDITDITVDRLVMNNAASGFSLVGGTASNGVALTGGPFFFKRIKVGRITGTMAAAAPASIRLGDDGILTGTNIDGLEIDSIDVVNAYAALNAGTYGSVSIGSYQQRITTEGLWVKTGAVVDVLTVGSIKSRVSQTTQALHLSGTITDLDVGSLEVACGANAKSVNVDGTVTRANVARATQSGDALAWLYAAATATASTWTVGALKVTGTSRTNLVDSLAGVAITLNVGALEQNNVQNLITASASGGSVRVTAGACTTVTAPGRIVLSGGATASASGWQLQVSGYASLTPVYGDVVFNNSGAIPSPRYWNSSAWTGVPHITRGTATLVAGTVTVANTNITATSLIRLMHRTIGGTPGALYVSAKVVATSFTITSTSNTDTSLVEYEVVAF